MILKNLQRRFSLPLPQIKKKLKTILESLNIPDLDLDITFTGDAHMRRLNKAHRGKDKTTDVLSFPLYEKKAARKGHVFLGDIVISVPQAFRQAKEYGKAPMDEIFFLIIHGSLHLLGFDHEKSLQEAKVMQKWERKLVAIIQNVRSLQ